MCNRPHLQVTMHECIQFRCGCPSAYARNRIAQNQTHGKVNIRFFYGLFFYKLYEHIDGGASALKHILINRCKRRIYNLRINIVVESGNGKVFGNAQTLF